jgi:hypothetical protein
LFANFLKACPRREQVKPLKVLRGLQKNENIGPRFLEAAKRERSEQGGVKRQYQGWIFSFFSRAFMKKQIPLPSALVLS